MKTHSHWHCKIWETHWCRSSLLVLALRNSKRLMRGTYYFGTVEWIKHMNIIYWLIEWFHWRSRFPIRSHSTHKGMKSCRRTISFAYWPLSTPLVTNNNIYIYIAKSYHYHPLFWLGFHDKTVEVLRRQVNKAHDSRRREAKTSGSQIETSEETKGITFSWRSYEILYF